MAWIDQHQSYLAACRRIAKGLRTAPERSTFKRDDDYAAVVGNDRRGKGVAAAFLTHLRSRHKDKHLAARVAANDRYGAPVRHTINGRAWSAGSLRFLQIADEIGDAPAVIEIGGGYGGQRLLCAGISDYTIVDLPEALDVQRAYLDLHGATTRFMDAAQPLNLMVMDGTFLLSDFALSELEPELIDRYIDNIVSKCARGRITCRASARDDLVRRLVRHFTTVEFEPEQPATSKHDNVVIRFQTAAKGLEALTRVSVTPALCEQTTQVMAERLRSSEPWAFSRWGDGEWSAILGKGAANCDGQAYAPLREPLRQVLRDGPSYLLGLQPLAVQRFQYEIAEWLAANHLTFPWVNADVFHDLSKSGELIEFVAPLRHRPVVLVGPGYLRALTPVLPYAAFVEVPQRNACDEIGEIREALEYALDRVPGAVVALSAGMSANILIHEFAGTPHTFIDFGSVWDPYVGRQTRSYHAVIVRRERAE